jgi:hypothetical protein
LKTPAFDHCLKVFRHWNDHESDIRDEMVFESENYDKNFVEPFRSELGKKLSAIAKPLIQKQLLQNYIHELNRSVNILELVRNILKKQLDFNDPGIMIDFLAGSQTDLQLYFLVRIHNLYLSLFNEIQLFCIQYDIPFFEICIKLNFPLKTINITITEEHQKNVVSGPHENSNQTNVQSETIIIPGNTDQHGTITKTGNADQPVTIINPEETDRPGGNRTDELNFKNTLKEVGFFNLKMVKYLPKESIEKLIGFIFSGTFPYQIAMLDYLGFIKQFEKDCITRTELYKQLGIILSVTDRLVQGNINILLPYSKGNKALYTSYTHKERVENDYQKLK